MTDKEKILAKVKSLLNETNYEPFTDEVFGRIQTLEELKSYIDSLPEEPVSEDLEEAIGQSFIYYENHGDDFRSDKQIETAYRYGFMAGVKCQKGI